MLDPICDIQLWPQSRPWPWIFKVKFWKSRTSEMGRPIDMGTKGMLHPLCGFQLWPHLWPCPWVFKVKYWNCCIRNGRVDSLGMKGIWVGYDGGCTVGNFYSFQPVGPWMGYSFTDLRLRGVVVLWTPCCTLPTVGRGLRNGERRSVRASVRPSVRPSGVSDHYLEKLFLYFSLMIPTYLLPVNISFQYRTLKWAYH